MVRSSRGGPRRRYQGLWVGQKFLVRVLRVLDGRTLHVESVERGRDYKVRLYGIDVPDKSKNEPYWKDCSDYLSALVSEKEITMQVEAFDLRSKEIIALLLDQSASEVSLSHAMVGAGWATCGLGISSAPELRAMALRAKSLGVGMWQP